MCSIVFLTSLFYPITIFEIIVKIFDQKNLVSPDRIHELVQYKQALIVILVLFQLGFTALTFTICIFIGHRIAGPIYKMSRFLTHLSKGENHGKLYFRKHDYFKEFAEDYNLAVESFQANYAEDSLYIKDARKFLNSISESVPEEKKTMLLEVIHKLGEVQARYDEKV